MRHQCQHCRFWDNSVSSRDVEDSGRCAVDAPVIPAWSRDGVGTWPFTNAHDGCGRFIPDNEIEYGAPIGGIELRAESPNPRPAAKPAEHGAPPVAAPSGELLEALVTMSAIREALLPLARHAEECRDRSDLLCAAIEHVGDGYSTVTWRQLRALLRAAGMFTDEMQAPTAPAPGPAQAAEVGGSLASAAPAFEDDHVEMIDVGASDDAGEERLT